MTDGYVLLVGDARNGAIRSSASGVLDQQPIEQAHRVADCRLEGTIPSGDHETIQAPRPPAFLGNRRPVWTKGKPLLDSERRREPNGRGPAKANADPNEGTVVVGICGHSNSPDAGVASGISIGSS